MDNPHDHSKYFGKTPGDQYAEDVYNEKMQRRMKISDAAREYIKQLDNPKASDKSVDDSENKLIDTIESEMGFFGGGDFLP